MNSVPDETKIVFRNAELIMDPTSKVPNKIIVAIVILSILHPLFFDSVYNLFAGYISSFICTKLYLYLFLRLPFPALFYTLLAN